MATQGKLPNSLKKERRRWRNTNPWDLEGKEVCQIEGQEKRATTQAPELKMRKIEVVGDYGNFGGYNKSDGRLVQLDVKKESKADYETSALAFLPNKLKHESNNRVEKGAPYNRAIKNVL